MQEEKATSRTVEEEGFFVDVFQGFCLPKLAILDFFGGYVIVLHPTYRTTLLRPTFNTIKQDLHIRVPF